MSQPTEKDFAAVLRGTPHEYRLLPETSPTEVKHSNPKDIVGSGKMPLELVPDTLVYYAATAYLEGALKYGRYNWRKAGVRASIYRAAVQRHIDKWWNGEWADETTGVPHIASAIAGLGIILDAHLCGKLNDDRPPSVPLVELESELTEIAAKLRKLFEGHNPHQYTIADDEQP